MNVRNARLRPGDLVEVRTPDEMPFMPEMLEFCGQRFRISRRALTICFSGPGTTRGFRTDDVVTLDGVRCSGTAHDGCQKACLIFWREAWLRKVEETAVQSQTDLRGVDRLRGRLKVLTGPNNYYCQTSELPKATDPLSRWQRLEKYLNGLCEGNFNALQMAQGLGTWLFWRMREKVLGIYARGTAKSTVVEELNLQAGEWVEVKSIHRIIKTLNDRGCNRGLSFSPYMRLWCGRRCRVKGRLDRIIVDGTGQMRQLRNTVCLEGSTCGCSYFGFGTDGCSRCEVTYWREAWLRRSEAPVD